jgi:hypothetical protein
MIPSDVFRCKTPDRVEQEFYGLLIACSVICRVKERATEGSDVSPGEISFVVTVWRFREAIQEMLWLPDAFLEIRRDKMLTAIARAKLKRRSRRSCPRAVKVKMSSFPLKRRNAA